MGAIEHEQAAADSGRGAEIVGVGKTKMYELIRVGAVESVRIGRCRRIPPDALATFVERLRDEASGYEVA